MLEQIQKLGTKRYKNGKLLEFHDLSKTNKLINLNESDEAAVMVFNSLCKAINTSQSQNTIHK